MVSCSDIAKYVINFFYEREDLITNLKLQKLLYYIQGWHLGLYNNAAFAEPLEAWVHGPVQPDVYREYKNYRWNPINKEVVKPVLSNDLKNHIDEVLAEYGIESAYLLERMTHSETPWQLARNGLPPDIESHNVITQSSMKVFFQKLA